MKRLFLFTGLLVHLFPAHAQWHALSSPPPVDIQPPLCSLGLQLYLPEDIDIAAKGHIVYSTRCHHSFSTGSTSYLQSSTDDLLTSVSVASLQSYFSLRGLTAHGDSAFSWFIAGSGVAIKYYTRNGFATKRPAYSPGPETVLASVLTKDRFYSIYPSTGLTMVVTRLSDSAYQSYNLTQLGALSTGTKMHFMNDSVGFLLAAAQAYSNQAVFLRTNNYGATWQELITDSIDQPVDFHQHTSGKVYLLSRSGMVQSSTDRGNSWFIHGSAPPGNYSAVRFFDELTGFIGGAGGALYKTINGGTTWKPETSNTSKTISRLYIFEDAGYFMTTDKEIYKASAPVGTREDQDISVRIYPNPTGGKVNVELSGSLKPAGATAKILVMDLLGKTLTQQTSDQSRITLDLEDLPPGMYLIRVTSPSANGTIKLSRN